MSQMIEALYSEERRFQIIFYYIIPIIIGIVYFGLKEIYPNYFALVKDSLAILMGYYFSIVAGHYLVSKTYNQLWKSLIFPSTKIKNHPIASFTSAIIGWVERTFYIVILQATVASDFTLQGAAQAIGFLLILKSTGYWRGRPEESGVDETFKNNSRTIYQFFLLGNALSIGYAFVGWRIILWLQEENPSLENKIWLICLLLIISNSILIMHIRSMGERIQKNIDKARKSEYEGYN